VVQDITSNAVGGIISGAIGFVFMVILRYYMRRQDRAISRRELIVDIKNKTYRSKMVMFLYVLTILQLAWLVTLFVLLALLDEYFDRYVNDSLFMLFGILIIMGSVMVPIAIYLHHRLKQLSLWTSLGIIVVSYVLAIFEASILEGSLPENEQIGPLLVLLVPTCATLLLSVYIGRYIARQTQSEFTMTQLFKRLPQRDKKTLIELVDSLPSVSNQK
jgi:hypothetical protein